jgi:dihydrofolate reductase
MVPDNPLGEGGDRLHEWMAGLGDWGERHDLTGPHAEVFRASRAHVGEPLVKQGGTTYTFVTGGIASALAQAQAAAGDKDVLLGGGADIVGQFLEAGLLDELQLHMVEVTCSL